MLIDTVKSKKMAHKKQSLTTSDFGTLFDTNI
jgi:hypothetical protein